MSRSRISKRAVAGVPGAGPPGAAGGAGVVGTRAVGVPGRDARTDAGGGRVMRVVIAVVVITIVVVTSTIVGGVLVGVLVGVGGAVPVPRLHVRGDRLTPATAHDLVDLGVEDACLGRRPACACTPR